ncbi:MAG: aminotransferase class I/II-fold pyridoxal phosphate-dependent enzyme [Pseudomonadota bacterium]
MTSAPGKTTGRYAARLQGIQPFRVMKLLARAGELDQLGCDVVHMEVGEPDFDTPAAIVAAGQAALSNGVTKYTAAAGITPLREAISQHYETTFGAEVPASRIFVTAGGSGALLLATALCLDPGEGFLMTDPGYPCNRHFLTAFNAEAQLVPVSGKDGYQLTPALVEQYWRTNTRGVLLATPANPTGAVVPEAHLREIADFVAAKGGHLVVDEIYQGLTYAPLQPVTVLRDLPGAIVVNSFSKYFGMTGWRLGWIVVPEDAILLMEKLAQNLFICPSSIAQQAALAAFTPDSRAVMESQRAAFQARRDFLVPALRQLGFDIGESPAGAFYLYAGLPDGLGTSESFCQRLLEEFFVAVTPGTDFGDYQAEQHVRFSFARDLDVLREGVRRIEGALAAWR